MLFKEIVYWWLLHLFVLHWLIMRVGFNIKASKPESSVNKLHLFKVLIASSTSVLAGCAICSSDSLSSFSSSPSIITSAGCSENSETIYSSDNGRDWLFTTRKCILGTLNWTTTSLLGLFLSSSFSSSYFAFKVTSLCFHFVAILNRIHKQLSSMH